MNDVDTLRSELCGAGQHADRALLDRVTALGPSVAPLLIEIATDQTLHLADQDNPAVWAPIHAVQLLGELGAVEAIQPLLPLFAMDEDDWLADALAEAFGRIGQPALPALDRFLRDREHSIWTRARAASALTAIGRQHPDLRGDAIEALAARLAPEATEPQSEDEATFNAFVICELLNLRAIEAMPAIQRAFDEDRVDRLVVRDEDVRVELGLSPPRPAVTTRAFDAPVPVRTAVKVGRNKRCPCGSGRKFKRCCGR